MQIQTNKQSCIIESKGKFWNSSPNKATQKLKVTWGWVENGKRRMGFQLHFGMVGAKNRPHLNCGQVPIVQFHSASHLSSRAPTISLSPYRIDIWHKCTLKEAYILLFLWLITMSLFWTASVGRIWNSVPALMILLSKFGTLLGAKKSVLCLVMCFAFS